jgi:hypothetical protein
MLGNKTDRVICPGYLNVDFDANEEPPRVTFDGTKLASASGGGQTVQRPQLGDCVGAWTLMALIDHDGGPLAVFEETSNQRGTLGFIAAAGVGGRIAPRAVEGTTTDVG